MGGDIRDLRHVLGIENDGRVHLLCLQGFFEWDDWNVGMRKISPSNDRAYVFLGPADKMTGEMKFNADGSRTITFTIPPEASAVV